MEVPVTKDIVFAYLSGNCSAFQKRLIEKWLWEESNQELFFLWLCEWERGNVQYQIDIEAGLERHRKWVAGYKSGRPGSLSGRNTRDGLWWKRRLAVAGVLLALAATAVFFRENLLYRNYRTAFGEIKKITLEDESKVVLNANSVLRVPRFFRYYDQRNVCLKGEASFEIFKSPDRKTFVVKTGDQTEIEVLGTVFNVYNRQSEKRIALSEGKVKLNYINRNSVRETITMRPGELATINKSGLVEIRKTADPLQHSAWKYHRFVFEDLTFREIGRKMEEIFGTRIFFADSSIAGQLVSGTFTALYPEELLDILMEGGEFEYRKNGNDFVIETTVQPGNTAGNE